MRASIAALAVAAALAQPQIKSGQPWFDTSGNRIYAGGGGFWHENGLYYWVGEGNKGISGCSDCSSQFNLYSSPDLVNWTFVGAPLLNVNIDAPVAGPYRMERPKIFKCPGTGKYSMWFHCDTPGFTLRSVGVLSADAVEGPYTFTSPCFKPDGLDSYDMGTYTDATGAYLVRSVMNQYAGISAMNDDCTNVTGIISSGPRIEGQAIMNDGGRYYLWGSHLTGWAPNDAVFSEAGDTLVGANWTYIGERTMHQAVGAWCRSERTMLCVPRAIAVAAAVCVPERAGNPSNDSTTFDSQSTFILPYTDASGETTYIYMGDRWNANGPGGLQNATYIWLPLVPPSASGSANWTMPWRAAWSPADL